MKKKLTLKLIETNEPKQIGNLEYFEQYKTLQIYQGGSSIGKVVKPYGISDEEIKEGDKYYSEFRNCIDIATKQDEKTHKHTRDSGFQNSWFKVEILPEQFNYQDIVDLGLKDGDILNVKSLNNVITLEVNKVTLLKYPEKHYWFAKGLFTYNEEQFDIILNEFGNALMNAQGLGQYQKSSNGVAQFVIDYLKKKKDGN